MKNNLTESTVRAWTRIMKVQQKALQEIEETLAKSQLPPLSWYDVLLELERAGEAGLRPFALEREMLLAQYNLSRLIDRIEKAGYVERRACADDGRGQVVAITTAGKSVRRRMWPVYAKAIQSFLGNQLTETEIGMLDGTLGKLLGREADR
jgi:DNA-binding MarR family transcriptional regulator